MKIIKVKNFEKYQHYHKKLITKWVKLEFHTIFDDEDFWALRDNERWVLIGFILWAGKKKNILPYDLDFLAEKISHQKDRTGFEEIVKKLIKDKYLIVEELNEPPGGLEVIVGTDEPQEKKEKLPVIAPDKEFDYDKLHPVHKLVFFYKSLKGVPLDDALWNKRHFGRNCDASEELYNYLAKDFHKCVKCMEEVSKYFNENGTKWAFETIVKYAPEWKSKSLQRKNVDRAER